MFPRLYYQAIAIARYFGLLRPAPTPVPVSEAQKVINAATRQLLDNVSVSLNHIGQHRPLPNGQERKTIVFKARKCGLTWLANRLGPVERIRIEPHPHSRDLALAILPRLDAQCVVRANRFQDGDLAVLLPAGVVLPEWLLRVIGRWDHEAGRGLLAGQDGRQVRRSYSQGVRSDGILLRGHQLHSGSVALTLGRSYWARPTGTFADGDCAGEFLELARA